MQDTFSFNIYGLMLYEKQKIRRYMYMEMCGQPQLLPGGIMINMGGVGW